MNSHCFPFQNIPHTTQLFLDFLDHTPSSASFYRRSAKFLEWAQSEAQLVQYPVDRRVRVAEILERQNRSFGASEEVLANISAFQSGALALVTGQQVGLFGGPAFSLYKALSAVKLSAEARKLGIACVPVFWLATEDHDLEEVNHVRLPGADYQLTRLTSDSRGPEDAPVTGVSFTDEITGVVKRAQELLGESEASDLLAECYHPGATYGTAFARLFARLFSKFGVILLDGSDPALDEIAAPLYRESIERAPELNRMLLARDQELQASGYHQQVRITNSSTPLFVMENGARVPLHISGADGFTAGDRKYSREDLLKRVSSEPESFSPNVLLRPLVQDCLLPTLAYVGGAAEVAYFAQVGALYEAIAGRVTPIVPRFSATLIDEKPQLILEKYRLAFSDVVCGPEALRETIGSRILDHGLQSSFEHATSAVQGSMKAVRDALARLDKTLAESAGNAESKMIYQIENLRSRAARAELRQSEVIERKAQLLSNALYPDKTLQEREFAGISLMARHGMDLLDKLLSHVHPDCVDHQLITL